MDGKRRVSRALHDVQFHYRHFTPIFLTVCVEVKNLFSAVRNLLQEKLKAVSQSQRNFYPSNIIHVFMNPLDV